MTVLSPFDEAIRDFSTAQHVLRIKKLLVYACTQHWETDPDRLAQYNLHYLIETLMRLAPTVDQLKTYLNQVTQTLSKPAEYLLIANTIVQAVQKLYSGPISSARTANANPHLYWQIAQRLEQEAEHLRIRKLLVLMCRNYWETDLEQLLTISVPDLLTELHQLTQSFEHLQAVVSSVVQTTSKPVQYGAIADIITHTCRDLYATQIAELKTEFSTHIEESAEAAPDLPSDVHPTHIVGINAPLRDSSALTQVEPAPVHHDVSHEIPESSSTAGSEAEDLNLRPIPIFSKAELYDLRLEMMKYTVPLLSKHLLFLVVYAPPGQASEEEQAAFANDPDAWMSLKARDLDDLIEASLRIYPTLRDLSAGLQLTVQVLTNKQRYAPVADAIIRAVKTLSLKHSPPVSGTVAAYGDRTTRQEGQNGESTQYASPSTVNFQEQSEPPPSDLIRINPPGSIKRLSFSEAPTQAPSEDETAMFSDGPTSTQPQASQTTSMSQDETLIDSPPLESSSMHTEISPITFLNDF
jgi:hypothetical protein